MRRILEEFPADRRVPVGLHLPLARPWGGFFHADLMAKAIDDGVVVLQVSYDAGGEHREEWVPTDWVWVPGVS